MPRRSLTDEENSRVIAAVRALLADGTTQVALAERLGVNQATLSSFLARRHRAGWGFARRVAEVSGTDVERIINEMSTHTPAPTWRHLPGAAAAFAEARRRFPSVTSAAWAWVESLAGSLPPSLDPAFLWSLAVAYANAPREIAATNDTTAEHADAERRRAPP